MKRQLIAACAALSLSLTACSGDDATEDETSAAETTAAAEPSSDEEETMSSEPSEEPESTVKDIALPDPHTMTGLSEVPNLPDPTPIEGDFTQSLPVTVTDVENNTVEVDDTSRILALDINGTLSRTVISLGLGDSLVGRTVSSTEDMLADLPVVTENGHSLNVEAIMSLNPTLVLADRSVGPPEAIDQLRQSGIDVVLVDPHRSIDTTDELIGFVAETLGLPEAGEQLSARVESEIADAKEQIAAWAPDDPVDAAFLYVRGTAGVFFILGSEDGATELINGVGANDVAGEQGITSTTPANAESLVTLDPEVIFVMTQGLESTDGMEGLFARPGVSQTRAGETQRVIAIPDGISLSFGPQTADILLSVARALYGVDE
ncbi:MAG: ABC transporter substrate-binding protein [Flaviflexus sp.]|nr:ABC transporter substrate-binding protein [Flaviflexus sp.]